MELGLHKAPSPAKQTPAFLRPYQRKIKESFKRPENANVLFSFITGNKNGISPYTKKAFKKVNLSHLFSPSGIHYGSVLFLLFYFFKGLKVKWPLRVGKIAIYSSTFFLPGFYSIQRLSILRILFQIKFISKLKLEVEHIFLLTFLISFLLGHYDKSPLGFLMSFAFLGTFFSFRAESKLKLILGLYSTQLIIGLFLGEKVSLLSIPIGLIGSFCFAFLFPVLLLFLGTFWLVPFNWGEPLLRGYIVSIHWFARALQGSFTSSSIFLILGLWVLMFMKNDKRKYAIVMILFFLHTNTAMTPVIFSPLR